MSSPIASLEPSALWKHLTPCGASRGLPAMRKPSWRTSAPAESPVWRIAATRSATSYLRPATKGREKAPAVILQGHVDMVAEKDKSTDFDFLRDHRGRRQGDWVVAHKSRSARTTASAWRPRRPSPTTRPWPTVRSSCSSPWTRRPPSRGRRTSTAACSRPRC